MRNRATDELDSRADRLGVRTRAAQLHSNTRGSGVISINSGRCAKAIYHRIEITVAIEIGKGNACLLYTSDAADE